MSRNIVDNLLERKLENDIKNLKKLILENKTRQDRSADSINFQISSLLQATSLLWFSGDTIKIKATVKPQNNQLTIWDILWSLFEHDSPTPSTTWHWPEVVNGAGRKVGKDFSIDWTLDWAKASDSTGLRVAYFVIKNLTADIKYGAFDVKWYAFNTDSVLDGTIAGV